MGRLAPTEVILPHDCDLGCGTKARRAVPSEGLRSVGPVVVLDHLTPGANAGFDLSPHPHTGLVKATYLLSGSLVHHDGLGNLQTIGAGDLGWLSAGRGVAHSEHAAPPVSGVQLWLALPHGHLEDEPFFTLLAKDRLPEITGGGKLVRLIAGRLFGKASPLVTPWDLLLADVTLEAGASLPIPSQHDEQALYTLEGQLQIENQVYPACELLVTPPKTAVSVRAVGGSARFLLIGGQRLDGPRQLWWTLLSEGEERLDQARADWAAGRFAPVPGEKGVSLPSTQQEVPTTNA
jgi:hypothetical protein